MNVPQIGLSIIVEEGALSNMRPCLSSTVVYPVQGFDWIVLLISRDLLLLHCFIIAKKYPIVSKRAYFSGQQLFQMHVQYRYPKM